MESHSQYLVSPPLLFMLKVSLHAFKALFGLIFHPHLCLSQGERKGKESEKCEEKEMRFLQPCTWVKKID